MRSSFDLIRAVILALALAIALCGGARAASDDTYDEDSVLQAASGFFGETSESLAMVIQKIFADHGRPKGYIAGQEFGGALGIGLRYGEGTLHSKGSGEHKVYWQGPSIGFDIGGDASKVFILVYHLEDQSQLFRRYPAVDGSLYLVAGVGANYQQSGQVILAPIRTGVGLRAGLNVGYTHYTRAHSWIPL